ncbi:hypothetical protein FOZ60_010479 [Perkinsus olseni]|uniref:Core-binding (CB) domain-containing protein n=1 Tax=Perkinsus olseni TaxID=32597 RepID=A0A7J6NG97_PEROL|nr:hypothetical protein FOZ60_010479 [Perkinsus olseni]
MAAKHSTSTALQRFFKVEEHLSTREVEERNVDFLAKSLRPSTMAQYETPVRLYERGHGKIRKGQEVTARNLVSFIRGLTMGGTVRGQTIRQYVSAVRSVSHIRTGGVLSASDNATIARALTAADNVLSEKKVPPKRAACLPDSCLQALKNMRVGFQSYKDQVRSAALLGCVNLLRFDQIATWRVEDVEYVYGLEGLLVKARFFNTKTQFYEEREMSCSEGAFCSANWCAAHWVTKMKRKSEGKAGYLFPGLKSSTFSNALREFVRQEFPFQCTEWNVDAITKHSLRRTGAAALAVKNVSDSEIKMRGNWRSSTWEQYAEEGLKKRCRDHARKILG